MLMVMMLGALKHNADHIHLEMTSYYISNQTATSEALSSQIEQEVVYKAKHENGSGESALAMRTGKNFWKTQKICMNLNIQSVYCRISLTLTEYSLCVQSD